MDSDQKSQNVSIPSNVSLDRHNDGPNQQQFLEGVCDKGLRPGSGQSISSSKVERPNSGQSISSSEVERPNSGQSISSSEVERPNSGQSISSSEVERPGSGQSLSLSEFERLESKTASGEKKATSGYIRSYSAAELDEIIASSYNRILSLKQEDESLDQRLECFSKQQFSNVLTHAQTQNGNSLNHVTVTDPAEIGELVDAKAERKKKKIEKRAREARKIEKARRKEQERIEADRMVAEVSKHRSMFNRNKQALPAIASKFEEERFSTGGKRKADMFVRPSQSLPENNVIDIIGIHEAQVRTTTFIREISQSRMNAYAELMKPSRTNNALEIIERHEEEFGTAHAVNNPNVNNGSADMPSNARSRCSSRVSRRGAA